MTAKHITELQMAGLFMHGAKHCELGCTVVHLAHVLQRKVLQALGLPKVQTPPLSRADHRSSHLISRVMCMRVHIDCCPVGDLASCPLFLNLCDDDLED